MAGVFGGTRAGLLPTPEDKPALFTHQPYTPVADHLEWVRGVLKEVLAIPR